MRSQLSRRHPLLLVSALAVPCLVLMVLGIQIVDKERELAVRRLADEPRRLIDRIGSELMASVERVKLDEAGRLAASSERSDSISVPRPEVAVVAWLRDGRLILPWDEESTAGRMADAAARHTIRSRPLRKASDWNSVLCSSRRPPPRTGTQRRWRAAAQTVTTPTSCRLARSPGILAHARRPPSRTTTGCSRARQWTTKGFRLRCTRPASCSMRVSSHQRVLELFERRIRDRAWFQPLAMYLIRDLLDDAVTHTPEESQRGRAKALLTTVSNELADIEQALALQREYATLLVGDVSAQRDPVWHLFGSKPWLVSQAPALAGLSPFVIAVRVDAYYFRVTG